MKTENKILKTLRKGGYKTKKTDTIGIYEDRNFIQIVIQKHK